MKHLHTWLISIQHLSANKSSSVYFFKLAVSNSSVLVRDSGTQTIHFFRTCKKLVYGISEKSEISRDC